MYPPVLTIPPQPLPPFCSFNLVFSPSPNMMGLFLATYTYTTAGVIQLRGKRSRTISEKINSPERQRGVCKLLVSNAGGGGRAQASSSHSPTWSSLAGALKPCVYCPRGTTGSQTLPDSAWKKKKQLFPAISFRL